MSSCTLMMRWTGAAPRPSEYLKAPRGRTAYEILTVRRVKRAGLGQGAKFALLCERHSPSDVPAGATVFDLKWDSRGKK